MNFRLRSLACASWSCITLLSHLKGELKAKIFKLWGTDNVQEKYPSLFLPQMEAIVFITLQIFFATCPVLKIGEYSQIFPSFSWLIFGHVRCSDQWRASENIWWIINMGYWPSVRSRWQDIGQVLLRAKEQGQYPATLTKQTWSIKDMLHSFQKIFLVGYSG